MKKHKVIFMNGATKNKDGSERKTKESIRKSEKEERDAKQGHRRGSWGDLPNDPRIDI